MLWLNVLSRLYESLNEQDLRLSLRRRYCSLAESRSALSLDLYGHVSSAQQQYYSLMTKDGLAAPPPPIPLPPGTPRIPQFELELWEEVSHHTSTHALYIIYYILFIIMYTYVYIYTYIPYHIIGLRGCLMVLSLPPPSLPAPCSALTLSCVVLCVLCVM